MSIYLERYAFQPLGINQTPPKDLGLIVVLPIHNEPNVIPALESLFKCELPNICIEVMLVFNESESDSDEVIKQNDSTYEQAVEWIESHQKAGIGFYLSRVKLSKKHAGVGLARKAGMDEAVRRFESIGNKNGIILCYDADCTCQTNYLKEVFKTFTEKKLSGASIYYEHSYTSLNDKEAQGIIQYELHLRYYVNALRKAGYPYAFHTVGSSMAVRSEIYQKAGGMNKRKAGEDFHFLHKVIPYGNFGEVNTTTVYPSARVSNRVPFGTGKAMGTWLKSDKQELLSYHPDIFNLLNKLLIDVPNHFRNNDYNTIISQFPKVVAEYLHHENYKNELPRINKQSTSLSMFIQKWFEWFNGLRALHFVHFLRDHAYPSIPITEAASTLLDLKNNDPVWLLEHYRALDKEFKAERTSLMHLFSGYL